MRNKLFFRWDCLQFGDIADDADEITIVFKTGERVPKSGFSSLVYTKPEGMMYKVIDFVELENRALLWSSI